MPVVCGHCGQTFDDAEAHCDHLSRHGWFEEMRQLVAVDVDTTDLDPEGQK